MTASLAEEDVACDRCGARSPEPQIVLHQELCQSCASQYPLCDRCDTRVDATYTTVASDEVCWDCARRFYTECTHCDYYAPDDSLRDRAGGGLVCENCRSEYWECERCEYLISEGDLCDDCYDSYHDELASIDVLHDYGYKPKPDFLGTGPLYFGMELEVSSTADSVAVNALYADDNLGDIGYLKEDGSINGDTGMGFEIVTHPMSYMWAMDNFPWPMLTGLKSRGCAAEGNGLHIHVSRAGFTDPAHIYRWMKFIYRNSSQVITIARRDSQQWAPFTPTERQLVKHYAKGRHGQNRYRAINTQNRNTFELRIFASSLDPDEVKAALALAAASVEYTRDLTLTQIIREGGWTWRAFARWVAERTEYVPLAREMEELACAC